MKTRGKQILLWLPRILAILFTLFLSLFAFDVFGVGYGFWETIGALLIHLIPNFILAVVVIAAWKRPWVGMVFFALLAGAYILLVWGKQHWSVYLAIPLPMLVISGLYSWNWQRRKISE